MADRRIRIAKDKVTIVRDLSDQDSPKGFFPHIVDILTFAAALGYSKKRKVPLGEPARTPDPIRQTVFQNYGYDTAINLLAVAESGDPGILANSDEMEDKRATIFEEYANGGLEILDNKLKGSVDYLASTLLLVAEQRTRSEEVAPIGFDLSKLID